MTTGWKVTLVGGIVATVVGGLILQALGAVDVLGRTFRAVLWLGASATVPRWTVALFWMLVGTNVTALVVFLKRRFSAPPPPWLSYLTDVFFGVRWRWQYFSNDYAINLDSIVPFCPRCDHRLVADQRSKTLPRATTLRRESVTDAWLAFNPTPETIFRCEACGFTHTEDGPMKEFARRVMWGIEHRIGKGERSPEATDTQT